MLRHKIVHVVQSYGGVISPLLLLIALGILVLLPLVHHETNAIDENAIGHRGQYVEVNVNPADFSSAEYGWPMRLIRGERSPGSEVLAIYVNTAYNASIQLANMVTASLRKRNNLGCDIEMFFVDDGMTWPVPRSYARAALVLNISSFRNEYMCLDIYGKHGLQANRDLMSTVLYHTLQTSHTVSLLCQTDKAYPAETLSPLQYYMASLFEAMRLPLYPQRWHDIPTRGIGTVAISSDPRFASVYRPSHHYASRVNRNMDYRYLDLILSTIYSLNGLEERFHHATYVYFPIEASATIPFEVAQFSLFLSIAAIISTGYAWYRLVGFNFEPLVTVALCVSTPVAAWAQAAFGLTGLVLVTASFVAAVHGARWNTTWMSINCAAIGLMEALQPATGLLGGAGVAIQLLFLHPAIASSSPLLFVGSVVSWLVWCFFMYVVDLPMWSMSGVSVGFVSLLIYPNAIWVTSRLLHSFRTHGAATVAPAAAEVRSGKKND